MAKTPKSKPRAAKPRRPKPRRRVENRALTVAEGTGTNNAATRLTDVGLAALERMAALGLRRTAIAARLGVGRTTLQGIIDTQPEAEAAYGRGRADLEEELVGTLIAQSRDGYAPAAMFLLKTTFGYRETGGTPDAPGVAIQINLPEPKSVEDYTRMLAQQGAPTDA